MTTNFVYIIYIRARRNQHQWVYSLWPGWCRQPAPSSFTLLCSLHHHQLHDCSLHHHQLPYPAVCTINHQLPYPAACTIISYPTLQPAPSSVTRLCSLRHHQLPYPAAASVTLHCSLHHHQLPYPAAASVTLHCSLHHHQLPYSAACSRIPTQSQNPVCCIWCGLLALTFQADRSTAGWWQKGQVSNIRNAGWCHSGYACASENVTLWLVTTMASFCVVDRTSSQ